MAKAAESVGSDKAELKMLLRIAAQKPVHMAFALGSDGKAMIKLDKIKQPKALEKLLKDGDKSSKNHRCGMVSVADDDPKAIVFTVEKAISGVARKLTIALKGTGFSKARIVLEDGSAVEEATGDDYGDAGGDDAQADTPDTDTTDTEATNAYTTGTVSIGAGTMAAEAGQAAPDEAKAAAMDPAASDAAGPSPDGLFSALDTASSGITPPIIGADGDPGDGAAQAGSDDLGMAAPGDAISVDGAMSTIASVPGVDDNGQDLNEPAPGADGPEGSSPDAGAVAPDASAGPQAAQDTPSPDASALTSQLTALVKQMLGVIAADPSQKSALAELATDAQASIKGGNLAQAAAGIDLLQIAITAASPPPPALNAPAPTAPPPTTPSPATTLSPSDDPAMKKLNTSQMAWRATRTKVDTELGKLVKAVLSASEGEDVAEGFEQEFQQVVTPILDKLDQELTGALKQASAETDPQKRQALLQQARKLIDAHRQQVESHPVIIDLDRNPFVPVAIGKTLSTTLNALSSAIG